jgi:ubiquinone/menaquinone biosynthesis C-methylase UbiE
MQRVLETEVMNDAAQVAAYAKADFSDSNRWYVEHLSRYYRDRLRVVVDLGCGPADVAILLARAHANVRITAVDGSSEMLTHARRSVAAAGEDGRVSFVHEHVPTSSLTERSFDAVLAKDFLHHLPDPREVRRRRARDGPHSPRDV